jgi:predicted transcriptional regulator
MAGSGYSQIRRLLTSSLPGNGAYRYGKPDNGVIPRKREHIYREVISIRLTPDTIEKLNAISANIETETGQRTIRNMLIEQATEAFVTAQATESAPESEAAGDAPEA